MKLFFCFTAGLLAAAGLSAADYYSNDFEAQSGIRFRAVNGESGYRIGKRLNNRAS